MSSDRPVPKRTSDVPSLVDADGELEMTQTDLRSVTKPPSAGSRDRAFLIILSGSNAGEMHPLKQPEIVLGRARNAAIRIEDNGVSRRHAKIVLDGAIVALEDLGSANGTLVNGTPLKGSKQVLSDGDKITLGSTVILKFTYSDEFEASFQRKLLDRALRDGLTNAFNLRYLMDRMTTELAFAKRHSVPLSLIMLDVDHFKRTNDTYGHPAGDAVLVKLAATIHATIRKEDVFARYGGEEFAVLLRGTNLANAAILAERLRTLVANAAAEHEGKRIPVTISVGVAAFPDNAPDVPEKLIAAADAALYQAKQGGRNRVVVHGK